MFCGCCCYCCCCCFLESNKIRNNSKNHETEEEKTDPNQILRFFRLFLKSEKYLFGHLQNHPKKGTFLCMSIKQAGERCRRRDRMFWSFCIIRLFINVTFISFPSRTRSIEIVSCVYVCVCGGLVVWITLSVLISLHHCDFISTHNFSMWSPILFSCASLSLLHFSSIRLDLMVFKSLCMCAVCTCMCFI